ncbi:MAG: hypothetical protein ACXWG1_05560 [Usitatibacter sp.]
MKRAMQMLGSSMFLSLAPMASAHPHDDPAALKVASSFTLLAGSEENALALACALHEGATVRLVSTSLEEPSALPDFIVFDPPTGKMGWNDVKMALMLARDALKRHGIVRPTLEQLQVVLLGGEVEMPAGKLASFRGVLRMRADGFNWGAIAAERYRRNEALTSGS